MLKLSIGLYDMLLCISSAVDLVANELSVHHQQVASLAYHIAKKMNLPLKDQKSIFIAGILHDIGALTVAERLALIEDEPSTAGSHAYRGARLLEKFEPFRQVAQIVRFHHVSWANGRGVVHASQNVPLLSHVLHLADRVSVLVGREKQIMSRLPDILAQIEEQRYSRFMPEAVDALMQLEKLEYVWLAMIDNQPFKHLPVDTLFEGERLNITGVKHLSKFFSHIIDFRSHFTATHSAGVAATAERLGKLCGFSKTECDMIKVAGYLHDIGKLSISAELLEKPSALSQNEYDIIRGHTFYTYQLLQGIEGFDIINRWASYHHERLNGTGYPFHLNGDEITLGSRIMAVADVFTALTESRPYRDSLNKDQVIVLLEQMVESGALCSQVVTLLKSNVDELTRVCRASQIKAAEEYNAMNLVPERTGTIALMV